MFGSSRRLLAAVLFTIVLVLAVNVAWWVFYDRTEELLDRQLTRRLLATAKTAAVPLTSEFVEGLARGDLDFYIKAIEILGQVREADSLSELFILDDGYRYLATTSIEADSIYFWGELNGLYIDSLFFDLTDQAVATATYRTGQVCLKSAFAPLFDSAGMVTAVLGVEANVDYFDALADLKTNLYYSSGLSLLGGFLFGLLFLLVQRRLNKVQCRLFLNETHASLGRMVAVVAHEIKNPLMIIRASAERLARRHQAQESEFIVEEVDRLNEIVTGYLDFAGGRPMSFLESKTPERINLREMSRKIRKHIQDKYSEEKITWLNHEIDADLTLRGYPGALRQVLLNLLINGVDACLALSKPIEVGIAIADKGDRVAISVIDHGQGMSRKEVRRAFDPFFTTKQSGSGLGLYLSRKIVAEIGGQMDIASTPGNGTEVIISLPKNPVG